jgi:hypothetical protein
MSSGQAKITEVASFPPNYFLENIAVRKDGSLLVTALFHRELWYIPPFRGNTVEPVHLHTFELLGMGIVEAEADVFYVSTGVVSRGCLLRFDLRDWSPGQSVEPEVVLDFSESVGMLNGSCLIGPKVILLADCFAGLIWRVDLSADGKAATVHKWLQHDSMAHNPNGSMPDQPGVNGVRYASKSHYLYYTSTARKLFMRIPVDPRTLDPAGEPELVAAGMMGDDFCIDEERGLAYITTHRENTIDCVSLTSDENTGPRQGVIGTPVVDLMIGPSAAAWGRDSHDYGRVAYVTTDGGFKAPMPDGVRPAKVLRVEL